MSRIIRHADGTLTIGNARAGLYSDAGRWFVELFYDGDFVTDSEAYPDRSTAAGRAPTLLRETWQAFQE